MSSRIQGINQENIKQSNRSAILKLIRSSGAISRKDIAQRIGLTPAAVSLICNELISEGILMEKGEAAQEKKAGRKKINVDINYSYKKVLCVCIEIDETYITITDMLGNVCAKKVVPTNQEQNPESFLKEIATESKELLWAAGIAKDGVLAAGVSVPGIVDDEKGISVRSYRIWNRPVDIKRVMEENLGFEVVVENNVKAFADGELIYGIGRTTNNLMFVKWGPGVGSAVTINHQVYQGRDFKGAEIGHYIIEKDGIPCRCGKRGCLETVVSTHAFVNAVTEKFEEELMPKLAEWLQVDGNTLDVRNIQKWGALSEPAIEEIFTEKIDKLALTVENVISILNPDHVVIYGKIFEVDGFADRFIHACKVYEPEMPDGYILKSQLSDKINYIGPLAVVMKRCFFGDGV